MSCPFKQKVANEIVWDVEPYSKPLKKPYYTCRLTKTGVAMDYGMKCVGEDFCPIIKKGD